MSKKNLIAFAVAAALVSPAAFAVDVIPATPDVVPSIAFVSNTTSFANSDAISITAAATDNYLGRNTGYNVRVDLVGGAQFASPVTNASAVLVGGGVLGAGSVTVAGGGTVGSTSVTFAVEPQQSVEEGDGIEIVAGGFNLSNAGYLSSAGSNVRIDVRVGDSVGGGELALSRNTPIASSIQPWTIAFTPGADDQRIDVGMESGKRFFGDDTVDSGDASTVFDAGAISWTLSNQLTNAMGVDVFHGVVNLTVTGSDFSAFRGAGAIFVSDATCAGASYPLTINAAGTAASVTSETVFDHTVTGNTLCFRPNGVDQITAQPIGASSFITQTGMNATPTFATPAAGSLQDMVYNGIVKIVSSFNPASNPQVDSLLRVINTSTVSGLFTIEGSCQDGTMLDPITFTLDSNNAVQYSSAELESGAAAASKPQLSGGLGSCAAGRSRLVVTGEVGTAEVQNFLRSATSVGVITGGHNNQD